MASDKTLKLPTGFGAGKGHAEQPPDFGPEEDQQPRRVFCPATSPRPSVGFPLVRAAAVALSRGPRTTGPLRRRPVRIERVLCGARCLPLAAAGRPVEPTSVDERWTQSPARARASQTTIRVPSSSSRSR
jgi:hypothetical protein